uniref:Secreted protein n=1 Tax=Anopheles culicifacies TaxID=139723 RepID=A0A182MD31_9DIPT
MAMARGHSVKLLMMVLLSLALHCPVCASTLTIANAGVVLIALPPTTRTTSIRCGLLSLSTVCYVYTGKFAIGRTPGVPGGCKLLLGTGNLGRDPIVCLRCTTPPRMSLVMTVAMWLTRSTRKHCTLDRIIAML